MVDVVFLLFLLAEDYVDVISPARLRAVNWCNQGSIFYATVYMTLYVYGFLAPRICNYLLGIMAKTLCTLHLTKHIGIQ